MNEVVHLVIALLQDIDVILRDTMWERYIYYYVNIDLHELENLFAIALDDNML